MTDNIAHTQSEEHKSEHWMQSKWRPSMGWMYLVVCVFDFVVAPVLWSAMQSLLHGVVTNQWQGYFTWPWAPYWESVHMDALKKN
jgi:hypothetical protein